MELSNMTTKTQEDIDTDSPKSLSFTNGSFYHHQQPPSMVVSYKECLKNHAATIGGHALDGCGEFMPGPSSTTNDPTSLKCAACGCHRNFHRRDPYDPTTAYNPNPTTTHFLSLPAPPPPQHPSHPPPSTMLPRQMSPSLSSDPSTGGGSDPSSPQQQQRLTTPTTTPTTSSPTPCSAYYSSAPHMLLALSTGGSVGSGGCGGGGGYQQQHNNQVVPTTKTDQQQHPRKRSRTKFSQEQKEKMCGFAEKLGWRMNKNEEKLLQEFCSEVGVSRRVFKVWMHNNKNAFGKKANFEVINGHHNNNINNNNYNEGSVSDLASPKSQDH